METSQPDREPDAPADNDADLDAMRRLQGGEDLALNELMSRWQARLLSFTFRYTGNHEDALDIAQETFVRVYEYKGQFGGTGKFSTWLFTIASNLCKNHARWRSRHPNVSLDGEEMSKHEQRDPAKEPWENADGNEVAAAVRDKVQALPHDLKTVVLLSVYDDRSHNEIAGMLRCTPKAVESRLYRAKQLLRRALSPVIGSE